MEKIDTLTGVRGLTAIWVILFHCAILPGAGFLDTFASHGALGVDVFFVLSGFVIAHVYAPKLVQPAWQKTKDFYLKRVARIYPAHLAILAGFVVLYLGATLLRLDFNAESYTFEAFVSQLFMLNGLGLPLAAGWNYVSWTVSAEMAAYLLFPLLAPVIFRLSPRAALAGVVALLVLMFAAAHVVNAGQTYFLPWHLSLSRVISEFLMGCLMYRQFRGAFFTRFAPVLAPLLLVAIVLVAGLSSAPLVDGYLVAIFVCFIPAVASDRSSPLARVLSSRPLVWLGEVSYSVYLVQNLVGIVVNIVIRKLAAADVFVTTGYALPMLATTAFSILCAAQVHRFVEKPGQKLLIEWGRTPRLAPRTEVA